jgi:hypothetical protein
LCIGIFNGYDGSTKNTVVDQIQLVMNHQLSTFTILPDTSDSISLNSFIASITQSTSPSLMLVNLPQQKQVCLVMVYGKRFQLLVIL